MARQARKREIQTEISILVESTDAAVEMGLNISVVARRSLLDSNNNDPLFPITTRLQIRGRSIAPEERAGEPYEISIWSGASRNTSLTLRDAQVLNEYHAPVFREYKGQQLPVYKAPPGLATIDRRGGGGIWRATLIDDSRLAQDMLLLVQLERPLFLTIEEVQFERERWIRDISLQTTEPALG
jgi:hypothetical protein